jgi:prepilin-type N-terminal cleavage/methylation domain-containing protein
MNNRRGVTLMEMMLVTALIAVMVGVGFPAVSSGVDSLRLSSATDAVASFLNAALNRAERRQQVMEVTISREQNQLTLRSTEPGFLRELTMPAGVTITRILPDDHHAGQDRHILLYPGGTVPRIGVELTNTRNAKKIVRVDPMTGVPEIENVEVEAEKK